MVVTNKGLFSGVKNLLSEGAKSRDGRATAPAVSMLKKALLVIELSCPKLGYATAPPEFLVIEP